MRVSVQLRSFRESLNRMQGLNLGLLGKERWVIAISCDRRSRVLDDPGGRSGFIRGPGASEWEINHNPAKDGKNDQSDGIQRFGDDLEMFSHILGCKLKSCPDEAQDCLSCDQP